MKNHGFVLNDVEEQRAERFRLTHVCTAGMMPSNMRRAHRTLTYSFTHASGIGISASVTCNSCQRTKNITDYDCW